MMRLRMLQAVGVLLFAGAVSAQDAADAYYDAAAMAAAREALRSHHGGHSDWLVLGERLEYQSNEGDPAVAWDVQAWIGDDIQKLWFKTEGEYAVDQGHFEEAEVQLLYSRAVSPFWDVQLGVRHDVDPDPSRTHAVFGVQGLAPYWIELDGSLFLSDAGVLSARMEAEYEFRLSQRLILQPRLELDAAFSADEEIGVGSGLSAAQVGLRLRYEVRREIAPYVGVSWSQAFGETRSLQRVEGLGASQFSVVAGLRFWY